MATKMFFRVKTGSSVINSQPYPFHSGTAKNRNDGTSDWWAVRPLAEYQGASVVSATASLVSSATYGIEVFYSSDPMEWMSPGLAADVTISGTVTFNMRVHESAMTSNCTVRVKAERVNSVGVIQSTIVDSTYTSELGTSEAAANWTATATSTNMLKGDRIRVTVMAQNFGTMGTGSMTFYWNGATGATGDSWIQFNETITWLTTAPSGTEVYLVDTASDVATAAVDREAWTTRGGTSLSDVTNTATGPTSPIQNTDTAGGTVVDWWTKPLTAFTLGGMVYAKIRGLCSTAGGATVRCEIAVANEDGSSPVVWGANCYNSALDVGMTSGETSHDFAITGDDVSVTNGQRIRIRLSIEDPILNAMASGETVTLYYNGPTSGASGDTSIKFGQTLTLYDTGTTFTPAAVAAALAIPTPTFSTSVAFTPAAVAAVTALTASGFSPVYTLAPNPVAAVAAPAVSTLTLGATSFVPAPVAAPVAVPAPTLTTSVSVTAAPVASVLSAPTPSIGLVYTFAPAAVAATASSPASTLATLLALVPPAVAVSAASTTSALATSLSLAPDPVAVATAITTPTIGLVYTFAPDPVAAATAATASVIDQPGGGPQTFTPDPVPVTLSIPAPTFGLSIAFVPDPVAALVSIPAPTFGLSIAFAPDAVAAATALTAPTLGLTLDIAPAAVAAVSAVPAPTLVTGGYQTIVRESYTTGGGVPTGAGPYTHTVSYPTGVAVDDYLVLIIGYNGGAGTISLVSDGWTLIGSATAQTNPDLYMYGRKATSAWSGTFTYTTSNNLYSGYVISRYSGVDTSTPLDVTAVGTDGAAATTYSLTAITTVTNGAMLVVGVAANSSSAARLAVDGSEPVTEFAEVFEASAKKDTMAADGLWATAGTTNTITGTIDQSLAWAGVLGALRPASGGGLSFTPAPVAVTLTITTPTIDTSVSLAPAAVAAPTVVATPTLDLIYSLAPQAISVALSVPQPTIALTYTFAPDAVAAVLAAVSSALGTEVALSPAAVSVTLVSTVSTVTAEGGVTDLAPDPVALLLTIPASEFNTELTLVPSGVPAAVLDAPGSTISLVYTLAPAPVDVTAGMFLPTIETSVSLAPAAVAAALGVPVALADRILNLTAAPVPVSLAAPGSTVERVYWIAPAPLAASAEIIAPLLSYGQLLAPPPVAVVLTLPSGLFITGVLVGGDVLEIISGPYRRRYPQAYRGLRRTR